MVIFILKTADNSLLYISEFAWSWSRLKTEDLRVVARLRNPWFISFNSLKAFLWNITLLCSCVRQNFFPSPHPTMTSTPWEPQAGHCWPGRMRTCSQLKLLCCWKKITYHKGGKYSIKSNNNNSNNDNNSNSNNNNNSHV